MFFRLYLNATDKNIPAMAVMNQEFTDLVVIEHSNPYRTCIQGLTSEPAVYLNKE